jgi:DNA-binding transcriptional LysR family regulator
MFTLRQIEVFNSVMESGSVVGAAKMLNVTQPVVSRVLRHLEDQAKVKLFERAKGRLLPTPQARFMFSEVALIFKNIRNLENAVLKMSAGEDTTLRVGASPSVAAYIVPKGMMKLRARYPKLVVRLDVLSVSQIPDYLVYGEGELVIGVFQQDHPSITNRSLGSGEIVAVTPGEPPKGISPELRVDELRELLSHDLIGFEAQTPHGRLITEFLARKGLTYEPRTVVRFAETACQMVRVGLGAALVDGFTAAAFRGQEITVRRLPSPPTMGVFAHAHAERGISTFGRFLCRSLSAELEGANGWFAATTTVQG